MNSLKFRPAGAICASAPKWESSCPPTSQAGGPLVLLRLPATIIELMRR